jgi:hypothetical protein
MEPRFEQFITEKIYLANVSSATEEWYRQSLRWLPSPTPNDAELRSMVVRMREKGRMASGVNCACRAILWASLAPGAPFSGAAIIS